MGFRETTITRTSNDFGPQAKIGVTPSHGLRVWIRSRLAAEIGWKSEDRFAFFVGEGDDAGKIRIVRTPDGVARMQVMRAGSFSVSLGNALGFELHDSQITSAKKIDADTVEVGLPDWSAGKSKLKFSAEQPHQELPRSPQLPTVKKPPPQKIAPPPYVNGELVARSSARKTFVAVNKNGVRVTEHAVEFDGGTVNLLESQASFIQTLVVGFGGIMVTGDIMQKTGLTAEQLRGDYEDLQRPLQQIGLKLTAIKSMGYCISKV